MRNMKKNVLVAAMLATLATSVALAQSAQSVQKQTGKIIFTGSIEEVACNVNKARLNDLGTIQDVAMGRVARQDVDSNNTKFDMNVILDLSACSSKPRVLIKGLSAAKPYIPLTNAGSAGVAKNVAIALFNKNDTTKALDSEEITYADSGGKVEDGTYYAKFELSAKYTKMTKADPIVAGLANAVADVEIIYE